MKQKNIIKGKFSWVMLGFLWKYFMLVGFPVESHVHRKQDGFHEVGFVKYSLFYCSMSRLIVKNLPKDIKEDRLRSLFSTKGEITDLKLCKTKDGKFRRFGFVGFKTKEEADDAVKYFNNSFIDTSKIQLELARNLGEKSEIRPWSKYSKGSSAYEKLHNKDEKLPEHPKGSSINDENFNESKTIRKKKNKPVSEEVNELDDDPEFQEFLQAHESRSTKSLSGNDSTNITKSKKKKNDATKNPTTKKPEKPKPIPSNEEQSDADELSSGTNVHSLLNE